MFVLALRLWYNPPMPIHILAPEVANQIAAGEVVERPASAVKELIENSLDAGATDIRVEVREGGRRLIRVQDDGCGIPAAEAALAFERHATSKLATADDLSHLSTLGFRGEALASIASVAQVALLTRSRDEETGTLIRLAEGREIGREPRGGPPGTLVTVEHLFANVPARLKFLKQPATEAAHIQQIVTRYALAYPERRLSLVSDGKLVFQSTGSGKLYDVLVKVYGLEMAREMLAVRDEQTNERTTKPSDGRCRSAFVLRLLRPSIRHRLHRLALAPPRQPQLHHALRQPALVSGYIHRLQRHPGVSHAAAGGALSGGGGLHRDAPEEVDVNVHPTKAEVRFRESGAVFSAVQKAVRRTLTELAPIPQVGMAGATVGGPAPDAAWPGSEGTRPAQFGGQPGRSAATPCSAQASTGCFTSPGLKEQAPDVRARSQQPASASFRATSFRASHPPLLPLLRVVGQLGATYIVAEGPDGMYLIDQHAAHERMLYEQMLAEHEANRLAVQPLLEPLVLDFSPEQAAVVAEELETLNDLGVEIEPFGGASYLVRSLPAILGRENPGAALARSSMGWRSATMVESTHEARLVTLICKRAAIKGDSPLSMAEMQEMVRQLEGCRSPRTCPHGRPTMIYLSSAELARQFGRGSPGKAI